MKLASQSIILLLTCAALSACSKVSLPSKDNVPFVYRIDVQQGNVVTQEMLAQLEYGMDKKKVEFIMGSPIISDTFHSNRWDYVYTYRDGHQTAEQRRVTLFFRNELLAKVEGDVVKAHGNIVTEPRKMDSIDVPPAEDPGLFSKVKKAVSFGDDDAPDQLKATAEDQLPDAAVGGDVGDQAIPETEIVDLEDAGKALETEEIIAPDQIEPDQVDAEVEEAESEIEVEEEESGFFGRMWDKLDGDDE